GEHLRVDLRHVAPESFSPHYLEDKRSSDDSSHANQGHRDDQLRQSEPADPPLTARQNANAHRWSIRIHPRSRNLSRRGGGSASFRAASPTKRMGCDASREYNGDE